MGNDHSDSMSGSRRDPADLPTIDVTVEPLAPDQPIVRLARGTQLGRYVVLDHIGEGGMGVVYKAYDPELDRTVALKLLQIGIDTGPWDTHARTRLTAEARAMARLSHPNVITVHDVGVVDDEIFLAMEFVPGPTLARWLREQQRTSSEILVAFVGAGRGIAAAHAANMVHRDFKPSNVIIAADGRARVFDFGLARVVAEEGALAATRGTSAPSGAAEGAAASPPVGRPGPGAEHGSSASLVPASEPTLAGHVHGTPRYMAPEQIRGKPTDGRTDQFAFCVALHEALFGCHPFGEEAGKTLRERVLAGARVETPRGATGPRGVRQILARGLAVDPADRYPTMNALLAELEALPRRARRRRWLAAATAGLLLLLGVGFAVERARSAVCTGAADHLAGVWDADRQAEMQGAFLASGHSAAPAVVHRLSGILDRYAENWVTMRTDACEATQIRGEQSSQLLDRRMRCLDRRLSKLGAMVRQLASEPDATLVDRSVEIAHELPDLRACADSEALQQRMAPPQTDAARRQVEALRHRIDEVEALLDAGRAKPGLDAAQVVVEQAQALDYAPLLGEALYLLGRSQIESGAHKESERTFERALRAASAGHDDRSAASTLIQLAYTTGSKLARHDVSEAYGVAAEAAIVRSGNDPELQASLLVTLATTRFGRGKVGQAREAAGEALRLREALFGEAHPSLAEALTILGNSYSYVGKPAEAYDLYARALAIRERAFGPDHPTVAMALDSLGLSAFERKRYDEARTLHERAVSVLEARLGADNVRVSGALNNLANVLVAQKRPGLALERFERATRLRQAEYGADSPRVAVPLAGEGDALQALGRHREALVRYRRALTIFESKLGPEHLFAGIVRGGLGTSLLESGDVAGALPMLERALSIVEAVHKDPVALAKIRFPLARALWRVGRERARSLQLARRAREDFRGGNAATAEELAAVEAWLAERGGG